MGGEAQPALVSLSGIGKRFGTTTALDGVSLTLRSGELHVLAGANGAGKSTLIRILSGAHTDYRGEIRIAGEPVRFSGPRDAARHGITAVHQELSLVASLSVADNLALGEPGWALGWRRTAERRTHARRCLARVGLRLDPDLPVEQLDLAERQLVEIARALSQRARVLILDEPTSALGEAEAGRLMAHLEALRAERIAMLYITHRLDEIARLADRLTVLRDGRVALSRGGSGLSAERIVAAMLPEDAAALPPATAEQARAAPRHAEPVALLVRELRIGGGKGRAPARGGVSLQLHAGEILGVAGLQGSGARALLYALYGALPARFAELRLADGALTHPSPGRCIDRGMVLISGDRGRSLVAHLSVLDNAALSHLTRRRAFGWLRRGLLRPAVADLAAQLDIDHPSLDAPVSQLSGGNQQKVALARCLLAEPRVLLLDDPTRGIDVGARARVHRIVRSSARRGLAVAMVSSELGELVQLCARVLVMVRGRVVAELAGAHLDRASLLAAAMGAPEREAP